MTRIFPLPLQRIVVIRTQAAGAFTGHELLWGDVYFFAQPLNPLAKNIGLSGRIAHSSCVNCTHDYDTNFRSLCRIISQLESKLDEFSYLAGFSEYSQATVTLRH